MPTSTERLAQIIAGRRQRSAVMTGTTTAAGENSATLQRPRNPMTQAGQMIAGGVGGSEYAIGPGDEGDLIIWDEDERPQLVPLGTTILALVEGFLVAGDNVTIDLAGSTIEISASGGGSSGQYRQFVIALDGTDWGFVHVEVSGQSYPVTSLYDLE